MYEYILYLLLPQSPGFLSVSFFIVGNVIYLYNRQRNATRGMPGFSMLLTCKSAGQGNTGALFASPYLAERPVP